MDKANPYKTGDVVRCVKEFRLAQLQYHVGHTYPIKQAVDDWVDIYNDQVGSYVRLSAWRAPMYFQVAEPAPVPEEAAAERGHLRAQAEALHDIGHAIGLPAGLDLTRDLLPVIEALREKADKYATIERIMKMLECDERQGGIWAACSLLLITCAHRMNSFRSVVEQECATAAGEDLGNWRVTVERIDAAMDAKEGKV